MTTENRPHHGESGSLTPDEYSARVSALFQELADQTDEFGDRITDLWRKSLPIADVGGLNLLGTATAMTARLHALGPHGDPLEQAMLLTIAWADRAKAQLQARVDSIEEFRAQIRDETLTGEPDHELSEPARRRLDSAED